MISNNNSRCKHEYHWSYEEIGTWNYIASLNGEGQKEGASKSIVDCVVHDEWLKKTEGNS